MGIIQANATQLGDSTRLPGMPISTAVHTRREAEQMFELGWA
jgi:hypothetical protein